MPSPLPLHAHQSRNISAGHGNAGDDLLGMWCQPRPRSRRCGYMLDWSMSNMPEAQAGNSDPSLHVLAQDLGAGAKDAKALEARARSWRPTLYVVASKSSANRLELTRGLGTAFIIDCEAVVGGKRKQVRDQAFSGLRQLLLQRLLVQREDVVICARSLKYASPAISDSIAQHANIENILCRKQAQLLNREDEQ